MFLTRLRIAIFQSRHRLEMKRRQPKLRVADNPRPPKTKLRVVHCAERFLNDWELQRAFADVVGVPHVETRYL